MLLNPSVRYLFGWTLPYNYGFLKLLQDKVVPKGAVDNFICQVIA